MSSSPGWSWIGAGILSAAAIFFGDQWKDSIETAFTSLLTFPRPSRTAPALHIHLCPCMKSCCPDMKTWHEKALSKTNYTWQEWLDLIGSTPGTHHEHVNRKNSALILTIKSAAFSHQMNADEWMTTVRECHARIGSMLAHTASPFPVRIKWVGFCPQTLVIHPDV